jgi:hypothetical protein
MINSRTSLMLLMMLLLLMQMLLLQVRLLMLLMLRLLLQVRLLMLEFRQLMNFLFFHSLLKLLLLWLLLSPYPDFWHQL